jgi:hypothetical protein
MTTEDSIEFTNFYGNGAKPEEVEVDGKPDGYSIDVLIDLDGNRKDFRIGWYDFDDKKWRLHYQSAEIQIEVEHMKWTNLPLNKE